MANFGTLYSGHVTLPATTITLRAGNLTMLYEENSGDLRYLCFGDHELLRRIHVAVRDPNWNTIPARITVRETTVQSNSFAIHYRAEHEHRASNIHFVWEGTITGGAGSTLTFSMDGIAESTFLRNRIGFCILHPMSCAGSACTIEHVDQTFTDSVFPVEIAPHQPFLNIRAVRHQVTDRLQVEVRMTGDIFEMEDQRNWTDASYKTYSTPLALPIPVEIAAGTRIQQSVAIRLIGDASQVAHVESDAPPQFIVSGEVVGRLPRLGVSAASHGQSLSDREIERLRLLNLEHLRADVRFSTPDWQSRLHQSIDEARRLGVALETALFLTNQPESDLSALRHILDQHQQQVATWLLFQDGHVCTPRGIATLAQRHLADYDTSARFAGGTDAFFVQLNRERPSLDNLDLLTYSINPQVHAFDNVSLIENLPAQAVTLASARQFSTGRGLMVSPVTLKLRYNPAATRSPPEPLPGDLPAQVDPRQASLFGAGWTLGSIKYLSEGGAESITYYETTGWLGVLERDTPAATSEKFPAQAGEVFPLFHILADTGEFRDGEVLRTQTTNALALDGLALHFRDKTCILLANFTSTHLKVDLQGIQGAASLRTLDEHNVAEAMRNPKAFRAQTGESITIGNEGLRLELAPFAVARLDLLTHSKGD